VKQPRSTKVIRLQASPHLRVALIGVFAFLFAFQTVADAEAQRQQQATEPRQILRIAEKLILKGDHPQAESLLRAGLISNPQDANLKLRLAFVLMKMRVLAEAYNICVEVATVDKQNSQAYAVLGAVLLTSGRFSDARLVLNQSLRISKDNSLALATLGQLEFYENKIDLSLAYLSEANFRAPDKPDYVFTYAQVAARSERYKEASAAYRRFLEISRDSDDERRARIRGLIDFLEYLDSRTSLYDVSGPENSAVPMELRGNRPVITLRVNGRPEPLRFVLDTGSGISVLSNETAKRLKIKHVARGGFAKGIGGDGKFEIVYGFLKEVAIGESRVRNIPVYIREFHQNVHKIDGYIGISLISKFLTSVDYGNRVFTLRRFTDNPTAGEDPNNLSLPLKLTSSGFLSGEVHMEGLDEPLNFIVDTGASVSVLSQAFANKEPFSLLPRSGTLRVVGSAGVTENVEAFTIPRIKFGNHSKEKVAAIALNLEIINDASGFEQAGILGGNFFLDYKMTFDFKNSRLLFSPTKPTPSETPQLLDEIKSLY
jgi:tetratricopeptide (TPR) repeat protein